MRCAEFTTSSPTAYDKNRHLLAADVAVDSHYNPSMVAINVKMSKTDQFRKGVTIHLGSTGDDICLVWALLHYLAICPTSEGVLFISQEGKYLTKEMRSFTGSVRFWQMLALTRRSTADTRSDWSGNNCCRMRTQ